MKRDDDPQGAADIERQFNLVGELAVPVRSLIESGQDLALDVLEPVTRSATLRLIRTGDTAADFFSPAEFLAVEEMIAQLRGTSQILGAVRIIHAEDEAKEANPEAFAEGDFLRGRKIFPMTPEEVFEFFLNLEPSAERIPMFDPISGARTTFTLGLQQLSEEFALSAQDVLKDSVQESIAGLIETGASRNQIVADINQILDDAGVTERNPQYAEMVARTNITDAFNQGAEDMLQDPDVIETFPGWRYLGIDDGREGDDHAIHFDRIFRSDQKFRSIRGDRVFNCRCTFQPLDKVEFSRVSTSFSDQ